MRCVGQTHAQALHQLAPGILFGLGCVAVIVQWIRLACARRRFGVVLTSSMAIYGGSVATLAFCSSVESRPSSGDGASLIIGALTSPLLLLHLIVLYLLAPRSRARPSPLDRCLFASGLAVLVLNVLASTEKASDAPELASHRRHLIYAEATAILVFYVCSFLSMDVLTSQFRGLRRLNGKPSSPSSQKRELWSAARLSRALFALGTVLLFAHAMLAFSHPTNEAVVLSGGLLAAIAYLAHVATFLVLNRTSRSPSPSSSPSSDDQCSSDDVDLDVDFEKRGRSDCSPQLPGFSRSPGGTLLLREGRPRNKLPAALPPLPTEPGSPKGAVAFPPQTAVVKARTKSKVSVVSWDRIESLMRPDYVLNRSPKVSSASPMALRREDYVRQGEEDMMQRRGRVTSLVTEASDYGPNTTSYHEPSPGGRASFHASHRRSSMLVGWHNLMNAHRRSQTPTQTASATPTSSKFPSGVFIVARCLDEGEQDIPLVPDPALLSDLARRKGKQRARRNSTIARRIASPSVSVTGSPTLVAKSTGAPAFSASSPLSPRQMLRHARKMTPRRLGTSTGDKTAVVDYDMDEGQVVFVGAIGEPNSVPTSAVTADADVIGILSPSLASAEVVRSASWRIAARNGAATVQMPISASNTAKDKATVDEEVGPEIDILHEHGEKEEADIGQQGKNGRVEPGPKTTWRMQDNNSKRASRNTLLSMVPSRVGESWEDYDEQETALCGLSSIEKVLAERGRAGLELTRKSSQLEQPSFSDAERQPESSVAESSSKTKSDGEPADAVGCSHGSTSAQEEGKVSFGSNRDKLLVDMVAEYARLSTIDSAECSTTVHRDCSATHSPPPSMRSDPRQKPVESTTQACATTAPLFSLAKEAGARRAGSDKREKSSRAGVTNTITFPKKSVTP